MSSSSTATVLSYLRALAAGRQESRTPDGELVRRFVAHHDEDAFTALVRRHGAMVLGVCRRVLRNEADAEDVFQATFLLLARKAASIRKPESVGCWLHGVACRLANKARAAARRTLPEARQANETPGPLDVLTGRELCAVLDEELQRLPERNRAPLLLCYLAGKTKDEAAPTPPSCSGT